MFHFGSKEKLVEATEPSIWNRLWTIVKVGGACLPLSVTVVACADDGETATDDRNSDNPTIIIDYGGVGSKIVQAYPGTSNSEEDRTFSGTFTDEDVVEVFCVDLDGRRVEFTDFSGEDLSSRVWFGTHGVGQDYYLSARFAELGGEDAQAQLESEGAFCPT